MSRCARRRIDGRWKDHALGLQWRECEVEVKREGGKRGGLYTPFLFHFILPFSQANPLFIFSPVAFLLMGFSLSEGNGMEFNLPTQRSEV